MNVPSDLRYLKSHEWARIEGGQATIGVTEFAVEALNRDIVFVELPSVGTDVTQGEPFGVIEAVKAVYDLYAPVSGRVVEINEDAANDAAIVGQEPFGGGWLIKVELRDEAEASNLLDPDAYTKVLETEETH